MILEDQYQKHLPSEEFPTPLYRPHAASLDNLRPSSRCETKNLTLPMNAHPLIQANTTHAKWSEFRDPYSKGSLVSGGKETVSVVTSHQPSNSVLADLTEAEALREAELGFEPGKRGREFHETEIEAPKAPEAPEFFIGEDENGAQENGEYPGSEKHLRSSHPISAASEHDASVQNPETPSTCNDTPNPFVGLRSEPLRAPKPMSLYQSPIRKYPSLFQDQFTQFMEDRMVMFRPSSSQNNIESSLYDEHPYQTGEALPECVAMRTWNHELGQSTSGLSQVPHIEANPRVRNSQPNESNSSFLPRGVNGPSFNEPASAAMNSTPQAIPLDEAKVTSPASRGGGCICVPFFF